MGGINTAIPLSVNIPQPTSPLTNIGSLMQLRDMGSQIALRNAEVADTQAQAQLRQRSLDGQRALQDVLSDPTNHEALANGDYSSIYRAAPPDIAQPVVTNLQTMAQKMQELQTGKAAYHAAGLARWGDALNGVDAKDPNAAPQLNAAKREFGKDYPDIAANIPDFAPGPGLADRIKSEIVSHGLEGAMLKKEADRQKTLAETKASGATAAKDTAEAALTNAKTAAYNIDPNVQATGIDNMHLDQDLDQGTRALLPILKTPEARDSFLEAVSKEQAGRKSKVLEATDPAIIAGKAKLAGAESNARIPSEIAARVGTASALNPAAPEVANVPLAERGKVQDEYKKSLTDLASKADDANRLHTLVQASQGGNQVTPTLAQLAELRTIVNRVTGTEFGATQGAGSTIERVQGWFNGKVDGQPIPPQIMKDMDATAGLLTGLAEQKHAAEVKAINIARHANLQPKTIEDLGFTKPAGELLDAQIPGQPPGKIHASQKARFLADHPGATVK